MRGNRLGAILVRMGAIDLAALRRGLAMHRKRGILLGQCLIMQGSCSDGDVTTALHVQRRNSARGGPAWSELIREIQFS